MERRNMSSNRRDSKQTARSPKRASICIAREPWLPLDTPWRSENSETSSDNSHAWCEDEKAAEEE